MSAVPWITRWNSPGLLPPILHTASDQKLEVQKLGNEVSKRCRKPGNEATCMYMCVCVSVWVHICEVCVCRCMCVHVCVAMCVCGCVWVYVCAYICACVMYACTVCACMCVYMCVYMCVGGCLCICVCVWCLGLCVEFGMCVLLPACNKKKTKCVYLLCRPPKGHVIFLYDKWK